MLGKQDTPTTMTDSDETLAPLHAGFCGEWVGQLPPLAEVGGVAPVTPLVAVASVAVAEDAAGVVVAAAVDTLVVPAPPNAFIAASRALTAANGFVHEDSPVTLFQ